MATYYVDAQNGSDAAAGTDVAPWQTLTHAKDNSTDGDTLKLLGTFREADVDFGGRTGVTIEPWGAGPWYMRNTALHVTGWTDVGGLVYTKNIGAGLSVKCLITDWNASKNANGQHFGHVQALSAVINVGTTDNSWFYNSGTGLLTVRIGANIDPATVQTEIGFGGSSALISAQGCTNCVIDGGDMGPNCDGTPGNGYSIKWSGEGNRVTNCTDTDCGYHGPGLVADGSQTLNGNTCVNYVSSGSWGDGSTAQLSRFVTYIGTGTASGNYYARCDAYKTLPLLRDGVTYMTAPVSGGTAFKGSGGWFWHTGGGTHASITHYRCRSIGISGGTVLGSVDFSGQDANQPTDWTNWNTYPVKNIECSVVFGDSNLAPGASTNSSQAFVRCRLDYGGISTIDTSTTPRLAYGGSTSAGSTWGHFNCQIEYNLSNAGTRMLFGVTSANRLAFFNCSFLEYGDAGTNARILFNFSSTPTVGIYARNTVFAFATASATGYARTICYNDNSIAASLHNFLGCAYRNVTAGSYSTNASLNTQAEWTSAVDTQATVLSSDPYADMSGSGDLVLTGAAARVLRPRIPYATLGVNNAPTARGFGSWGTGGTNSRGRRYRGR
jgi:hypothetical protein